MNLFIKMVKSTSKLMAIVLLLATTSYQYASAAMIGTEKLLQAGNVQGSRIYLEQLMSREEIKLELIAQGIDPQEAHIRIQSLTDEEIQQLAVKIDDLSAGGGVATFSLIVLGVIVATVLLFKYTSITDVFP